MDDQGLNRHLLDTYGLTFDGLPLFRVIWSTNVTEKRKGTFRDMYDDLFIREVTEVRETLKYPFAQDRWVLETVFPTPKEIYGIELFDKWIYEGIYIFQDKHEQYLPLNREMLDAAMYLYLVKLRPMSMNARIEHQMSELAKKDKAKKERIRGIIGEELRSPNFFVMESIQEFWRMFKRRISHGSHSG